VQLQVTESLTEDIQYMPVVAVFMTEGPWGSAEECGFFRVVVFWGGGTEVPAGISCDVLPLFAVARSTRRLHPTCCADFAKNMLDRLLDCRIVCTSLG